mgnify:CR=1 FL=1
MLRIRVGLLRVGPVVRGHARDVPHVASHRHAPLAAAGVIYSPEPPSPITPKASAATPYTRERCAKVTVDLPGA